MENMEYIDDYFKGSIAEEKKKEFEQRIITDVSFAEEVAFYISANGLLKHQLNTEKKDRFKEIYQQQKVIPITKQPVKKIWRYMAAACVVAIVILLTWFMPGQKTSPQQLADQYIQQNFQTLSVTMSSKQDSLQNGISLLNAGKLSEGLKQFESIVKNDPGNDAAKKYAGIVSLRQEDYTKALLYFTALEMDTSLISNPGKLYHAVTLMKRNKNGDKEAAKLLLQQVADNNLEGKNEAGEWLKKL